MRIVESYVRGEKAPTMLSWTIGEALHHASSKWPDNDAVVDVAQAKRVTYSRLNSDACKVSKAFQALGLNKGDRVGIWAPNSYEWILTQYATAIAGIVLVNINPAYTRNELHYSLSKVGCRALILCDEYRSKDYLSQLIELMPELSQSSVGDLKSTNLPELDFVITLSDKKHAGCILFDELLCDKYCESGDVARGSSIVVGAQDPINIQFTSGTTGAPKGATLTHNNIVNNGYYVGERLEMTAQDRICLPVPLYHCFGMVMGVLAAVTHGSTVVLPSPTFDAEKAIDSLQRERCTVIYGVPTMFLAMLQTQRIEDCYQGSLRSGIMAGANCNEVLVERVINCFEMESLSICYGMTEASPVIFQTLSTDSATDRSQTVGIVHPHIEAKVINEAGEIAPLGTAGEICVRGYSVMLGYWGDSAASEQAVSGEGWLHTGDIGTIDNRGYCRVVGRKKDVIIRGGENIFPKEIEDHISAHAHVLDVQIVGVPDPYYGEVVCACVIRKKNSALTADDLVDFCSERIAGYKIPKYFIFINEFPMTITGKVKKFELREYAVKTLNNFCSGVEL